MATGWWAMRRVLDWRPELPSDRDNFLPAVGGRPFEDEVRMIFLGVSTMILRDSDTTLIIDGFFTRPRATQMLAGRIAPNRPLVQSCLSRSGVTSAAAVFVTHSHYDHAMDAPLVAELTGATLIGSESTRQVGRGWGLPDDQMQVARPGEAIDVGRFNLTPLISRHAPHAHYPGQITTPVAPPAKVSAYRMAECFALQVRHRSRAGDDRTLVINSSAGFEPRMLQGRNADTVFLGIGTMGKQTPGYMEAYWENAVAAVRPRAVVPIHWDDFTRPLSAPLVPFPYVADNMTHSMAFLRRKCGQAGIELRLPVAWTPADPFFAPA